MPVVRWMYSIDIKIQCVRRVRLHIDNDPVLLPDLLFYSGGKINVDRGPELDILAEEEKKLDEPIQTCVGQMHWMCEDHYCQRYPYLYKLIYCALLCILKPKTAFHHQLFCI